MMSNFSNKTQVKEFRFILLVNNLESQKKFYEETFNWPIVEDWGGGILYNTGDAIFELIQDKEASRPNDSCRVALSIPNVWELYEEIKDKVIVIHSLKDNSWGDTSFRIKDPDGFSITLFSPTKTKQ